ncbi:MAG: glycoside hydrolase family 78 protein [Puniceicoccales bacterium]|jgi:alpha-L-rhamnosidase|nr:glycoside hydrolase family 78 protein [Puniceicoccales bacterium]
MIHLIHRFRTNVPGWALALLLAAAPASAQLTPSNLLCESLDAPSGIDAKQPRLSWALTAANPATRAQKQSAVQILVASSRANLDATTGDIWDSGRVSTDDQAALVPAAVKLATGTTYYWKARTWDQDNRQSPWSTPATWTTGLLDAADWAGAKWIGQPERIDQKDSKSGPTKKTHWLRKNITLAALPPAATFHVASIGYHELYVNGQRVGDTVLDPAVSNPYHRVYYRTYDVRPFLRPGKNTVALWLGQGWAGWGNWNSYNMNFDSAVKHGPVLIGVLRDQQKPLAVTDATWKSRPANLSASNQWMWASFGGEQLDLTAALPKWNSPDLDDSSADWPAAKLVTPNPLPRLTAHAVQPNRVIRTFKPVSVEAVPGKENTWRIDFGKNYNGWVTLPLHGPRGTQVTLSYTEKHDPKKPLKDLAVFNQVDQVILSGDPALDRFQNRFNYHQFRWLTVEGVTTKPDIAQITASQIRTDYANATTFESSDSTLNQIHDLVLHTYECLTLGGYIVDCSHRERGGYGAEGQASMETGMTHFDSAALLRKWTGDWRDLVRPDGGLPNCAPTYWGGGGPAWKMALINLPVAAHTRYADNRVLEENYAAMSLHIESLLRQIDGNSAKVFPAHGGSIWDNIGDWYAASRKDPPRGQRLNPQLSQNRQFFNNAFIVHTLDNLALAARHLGKTADAQKYTARADALRAAVHKALYNAAENTYGYKEQTNLALALQTGITPEDLRDKVAAGLETDIRETHNGHITSGVLGTYMQLKYLTRTERSDLIYLMLTQPGIPGWVNFLKLGYTTVPEVWDPVKAPPYGQSVAHSSFISVGAWFVEGLVGIRPDPEVPGFKHFFISPGATEQVEWVKATHKTVRGEIAVQWKREKATGKFILEATIPPNTTATVRIPAKSAGSVTEGGKPVSGAVAQKDAVLVSIGSGTYRFEAK